MSLRIDVLKYRGHVTTEPISVVFDQAGGTIGRSVDNRLVLPDDCISRKHARITYENGRYCLTDESANGTLIFNRDLLVHYEKVDLHDGDMLKIGDYELSVTITEESRIPERPPVAPGRGVSHRSESEDDLISKDPSGIYRPSSKTEGPSLLIKEMSIDDFFKDTSEKEEKPPVKADAAQKPPAAKVEPAGEKKEARVAFDERKIDSFFSDIDDFFKDTGVEKDSKPAPPPDEVPAGLNFEKPRPGIISAPKPEAPAIEASEKVEEVAPAEEPVVPALEPAKETAEISRQEIYRELFSLFLKGAQVEEEDFAKSAEIPQIMETLGAVYRELVKGLWTVLRGRTELKAEIRLAMTMVSASHNNPLKLSPRIEDALKRLMKKDHPSFLGPIDAVREGFEDVMNHQLAMNAGIQASLLAALDRFDPENFAEKDKNGSIFQTKAKYWKDYCAAFPGLKEQASEGIFGKAFVQAYEEQLEKLRSKQKKN